MMRFRGRQFKGPNLLIAGVLLVGLVAGVYAASTSTAAFGSYNPTWDGSSEFRTSVTESNSGVIVASDTARYDEVRPASTTAIIIGPTTEYDAETVERMQGFVREGGTLVVASDFGTTGNQLLADLGVESRVDGRLLRDERFHGRTPAMPRAINVTEGPLTRNVSTLALNYASVIEPGPRSQVLVRSSEFAYLDANRNDALDDNETVRSFPIVVREQVGSGSVVVVSDPSVFINFQFDEADNRAFARSVVNGTGTVLLDYSHSGGLPPLAYAVVVLRRTLVAQIAVGGVVVVGLWLVVHGRDERLRERIPVLRSRRSHDGANVSESQL